MNPSKVNLRKYFYEYQNIMLFEALKLLHDKERGLLAVSSDHSDPKQQRQETFNNKNKLKNAGFTWRNGYWTIDDSQFEKARNLLSTINQTEYLITKLEDLKGEVDTSASNDPKKKELSAKLDKYISDLANSTDEAAASEEIRKYLDFFSGFHQYSWGNRILIYIQRPDATKVAAFNKWKEKGRRVKKGGKGIMVMVPIFRKGENPKNQSDDDETGPSSPITYKVGYVYDISDTEATSEKGEIPETPEWWGSSEPSEVADELFELVIKAAESEGIDITNDVARHEEKGFSEGGHINISSEVEGAYKVSVLVHEYAHELMHWEEQSKFYVGRVGRAVAELQAESVSYVVLKHYGIPCKHHTTYLALWKANKEKVRQNIQIISEVGQYIINKIEKIKNTSS